MCLQDAANCLICGKRCGIEKGTHRTHAHPPPIHAADLHALLLYDVRQEHRRVRLVSVIGHA